MKSAIHFLTCAGAAALLLAPAGLEASPAARSGKKATVASSSKSVSASSKAKGSRKSKSRSSEASASSKKLSKDTGLDGYLNMPPVDLAAIAKEKIARKPLLSDDVLSGIVREKPRYPWKTNIVTTTFWVGEQATKRNPVPNHKSSWDTRWAKNYGGYDDPNPARRSNYLPVKFTPGQNPFYIALPYNDLQRGGTKPEAASVIPWFKEEFERSGKTVLKGRWVAIRFKDRVAYAQWEDCGPFRTDHWQYVFGNERPKPNLNKGAGLDVSPAVRDYLGMKDTDVTDWRFVEFEEVPRGPWAIHGDNNTFVQRARDGIIQRTVKND